MKKIRNFGVFGVRGCLCGHRYFPEVTVFHCIFLLEENSFGGSNNAQSVMYSRSMMEYNLLVSKGERCWSDEFLS